MRSQISDASSPAASRMVGLTRRTNFRACCFVYAILSCSLGFGAELEIERSTIVEGNADWDWTQARTAMVRTESPYFLTTMSRTAKVGSHGYHDVYVVFSNDHGRSWTKPAVIPSLKRSLRRDGYEVVAGDLCPLWHSKTGKILVTGKTFNFAGGTKEDYLREQISYSVFDPVTRTFGPLQTVDMPEHDHQSNSFVAPNAGCHQQAVLAGGNILLPIRYQQHESKRNYTSIVARCRFDGRRLTYVEHGSEHSIPTKRGLYEPSVTEHDGSFYLTLRADGGAYVAKSEDGIQYSDHVAWKFDDGKLLGSYNTQQHWVTLGDKLYLVYTRRGADNDHIMRHREPLFIARVETETLTVIRDTEQIIVPENHATLGNSGVCHISDHEAWITVAEGRVGYGQRKGENNRVFLVKVRREP